MKKIFAVVFLLNIFLVIVSLHAVVIILFMISDGMELETGFRYLSEALGFLLLTGFWAYIYKDIVE